MSDFEERLDPRYTFGARGGPVFSTEVVKTTGGQVYTNRNWILPLHRYDITEGVKKLNAFEDIRSFFYNVYGQADAFRVKWWPDYVATNQPLAELVVGSSYQMERIYTRGARTFHRTVNKPVSGTVVMHRVSSGGVTTTITPSINYTTGVVAITGHTSGDTYFWTGEFDVRVAFMTDALEEEVIDRGAGQQLLVQWPSIQLEERRL